LNNNKIPYIKTTNILFKLGLECFHCSGYNINKLYLYHERLERGLHNKTRSCESMLITIKGCF